MAVYELRSDVWESCPICHVSVGSLTFDNDTPARVNHAQEEHDAKLLHVGQQTVNGADGPWQATVYVMEVEGPLPPLESDPEIDSILD
jgi:hypothetical protein